MIGQLEDLQQTELFRELNRRANHNPLAKEYRALIEASFGQLHTYLDEVRRYFYHFTDHCITHSIRIIHRISSFLSQKQLAALSVPELYLLIGSALIHDIGMVISESEAQRIWEEDEFQRRYQALLQKNRLQTIQNPSHSWFSQGVGRQLVAEYVRQKHGHRANLVANSGILPMTLLTGDKPDRRDYLGRIAEAHTTDFDHVANEKHLPTDVLLDERRVNTRFVAICLRIGDLLDINTSRVCPLIRELSEPLSYLSASHWDQYSGIRLHDARYGTDITVSGTLRKMRIDF